MGDARLEGLRWLYVRRGDGERWWRDGGDEVWLWRCEQRAGGSRRVERVNGQRLLQQCRWRKRRSNVEGLYIECLEYGVDAR